MTTAVNEGASVFYLLSCLHTQGARSAVNATQLHCTQCGELRDAIRVVNTAWRIECASCQPLFKRFFPSGRIKSIQKTNAHLRKYPDHVVKVFDGAGNLVHTMRNDVKPLFRDETSGAPF